MSDYQRSHLRTVQGYAPSVPLPYSRDIIKLNSNENPYPPSPKVLEALQNLDSEYLRRYQDPNATALRETIGHLFAIAPDYLCIGNGADHILELIFRGFIEPQDTVVYPSPTYSLYSILTALEAGQAVPLPFTTEKELPIDGILQAQGKLTLIASPASPTGHAIPIQQLQHLAQTLEGLLIIDEAYCDFAEETALALVHRQPNVILIRTLSKGYSLAGIRLGYAIAHPDLIAVLNKVKDSYSVDAIALQLGIAALQDQEYKDQIIAQIKRSRQALSNALTTLDWTVTPSATNFLWVQPKGDAEKITQQLQEHQIYIRHYAEPKLKNHVRITVGTEAQHQRLLQVLNSIL